jgi:F-type H+-transporting ATPase subunit alpha
MPVEEQVISIFAGVRGYLDKIAVTQVGKFEAEMLRSIRAKNPEILESLRKDKQITPDTETKLKAALDSFSASFA